MYTTWPLSIYTNSPEPASPPPSEGENSGYLVIFDEESEAQATCCWGMCKDHQIRNLPFPQNKTLTVEYTVSSDQSSTTYRDKVYFIPALNEPLSSNRYYVVRASGKHKGEAITSSREEDMGTCFCCNYVKDVKPKPLDHMDSYQQVEITPRRSGGFVAKSIEKDGFPPKFLRRKGWRVHASTPQDFQLGEAHGLNPSLRSHSPLFDFAISDKHSLSLVVGKWYIPFMFVKEEGSSLKDQMKISMFYEMYLEKLWEEIYMCENNGTQGNVVAVNTAIERESATLSGVEEDTRVVEYTRVGGGIRLVAGPIHRNGGRMSVWLSTAVVGRMKSEASRGGWIDGNERHVTVEKTEEFVGENGWRKFGCYMLVERFVLKRLDGNVVLTYEFRHPHVIQSKWE